MLYYRLLKQTGASFLTGLTSGLQAWSSRGYRDNTMTLQTLCEWVLQLGESIVITFVDYLVTFLDTVSHNKFPDEALVV